MASDEEVLGEPVLMTFAFTLEEWAKISAALMAFKVMANEREKQSGMPKPEEVADILNTTAALTRMIREEVERYSK